jgi:hypothetical protein
LRVLQEATLAAFLQEATVLFGAARGRLPQRAVGDEPSDGVLGSCRAAEGARKRLRETVPERTRVQDTDGLAGCGAAAVRLGPGTGPPETGSCRSCHLATFGGDTVRRADSISVEQQGPVRLHPGFCNRACKRNRDDSERADGWLARSVKAQPPDSSAKSRRIQFADTPAKAAMTRGTRYRSHPLLRSSSAGSALLARRSTVAILSIILYVVLLPNIAILKRNELPRQPGKQSEGTRIAE